MNEVNAKKCEKKIKKEVDYMLIDAQRILKETNKGSSSDITLYTDQIFMPIEKGVRQCDPLSFKLKQDEDDVEFQHAKDQFACGCCRLGGSRQLRLPGLRSVCAPQSPPGDCASKGCRVVQIHWHH